VRRNSERGRSPRRLLPVIRLPLVEEAVLGRGDKLLGRSKIIRVVRLPTAGQRNDRRVVKIVIPETIKAVASFCARSNEFYLLRFVLSYQNKRFVRRAFMGRFANRAQDVLRRIIVNILGRIEAEAVEMKFIDPVAGIGDEKLTHLAGVF